MSLAEQLDAVTASIPEPLATRIATGVAELSDSHVAPGLQVGDLAPAFVLPDAFGNHVSSAALLAKGPLVVTFYRGDWCPFCNLQLGALQAALAEITATGATLVAISPQAADHNMSVTEKHALGFSVLSDLDQSVADAYKIRFFLSGEIEDLQVNVFGNDPAAQNANGERSLPVASTFIINTDSTVAFTSVNADWRSRVEPSEVVSVLEGLAS